MKNQIIIWFSGQFWIHLFSFSSIQVCVERLLLHWLFTWKWTLRKPRRSSSLPLFSWFSSQSFSWAALHFHLLKLLKIMFLIFISRFSLKFSLKNQVQNWSSSNGGDQGEREAKQMESLISRMALVPIQAMAAMEMLVTIRPLFWAKPKNWFIQKIYSTKNLQVIFDNSEHFTECEDNPEGTNNGKRRPVMPERKNLFTALNENFVRPFFVRKFTHQVNFIYQKFFKQKYTGKTWKQQKASSHCIRGDEARGRAIKCWTAWRHCGRRWCNFWSKRVEHWWRSVLPVNFHIECAQQRTCTAIASSLNKWTIQYSHFYFNP